ncbi:MAG: SRPBCC family protein, partial [Ardenticatenaceae bacterium]
HVGRRVKLTVKSALGYRLKLDVEIVEMEPPRYLSTLSRGQLEGTGVWEFAQEGDKTVATWTWIVESHHPLLNLLEPVAKGLFRWSHNDASRKGHRGLKRLLET